MHNLVQLNKNVEPVFRVNRSIVVNFGERLNDSYRLNG